MLEPLFLPQYAESLQEQRQEAITLTLHATDDFKRALREIGNVLGEAMREVMASVQAWFQSIAQTVDRAFRGIEPILARRRRPRRRSSRRLAVQMKRTRLGLDIYGRPA